MADYKKGLPDLPLRIAALPVDHRGFPVPWFVEWRDGKPNFRIIAPGKMDAAFNDRRCWICGDKLGAYLAFVIGPMCSVTRRTSEPPSHYDCAEFAVKACPFLTQPAMKRNTIGLGAAKPPPGEHHDRNPGCALIWVAKDYAIASIDKNGKLFKVGEPDRVEWWTRGRPATHEEARAALEGGLVILRAAALKDGIEGAAELERYITAAEKFLPGSPL